MTNAPPGPGNPFPCGAAGEPGCPPQPAIERKANAVAVLRWYKALSDEHKAVVDAAL
jgi:hypothetical protein